jgi:hypothetical protein
VRHVDSARPSRKPPDHGRVAHHRALARAGARAVRDSARSFDATRYLDNPKKIGKVPLFPWKQFQKAPPTEDELTTWFCNGEPRNLAGGSALGRRSRNCRHSTLAGLSPTLYRTSPGSCRAFEGKHDCFGRGPALRLAEARQSKGRDRRPRFGIIGAFAGRWCSIRTTDLR